MDFTQILRQRYALPQSCITRLMQQAERTEHHRKQTITEEGRRDPYAYFVERGSVRTFVMREDKCVIFAFAFEGDAASSTLGVTDSPTSRYTIETLEPSTLLRIPRERLEVLFTEDAELANWGRKMVERQLLMHEAYFADYCWMDKSQQYERLLREYPQLLQRVPLKDLASYLFVTPQSLSRIRAEMK